jgi:PHP family Zn ribbon phosphoesterase
MRKFSRLSNKIWKKGYSFDPKKGVFRSSGSDKNKTCYNCGEKEHISPNCFKSIKKRSSSKNKKVQELSDEEEDNHKGKKKSYEKKKSYYKKTKLFPKKKRENMRSFVVGTQ